MAASNAAVCGSTIDLYYTADTARIFSAASDECRRRAEASKSLRAIVGSAAMQQRPASQQKCSLHVARALEARGGYGTLLLREPALPQNREWARYMRRRRALRP